MLDLVSVGVRGAECLSLAPGRRHPLETHARSPRGRQHDGAIFTPAASTDLSAGIGEGDGGSSCGSDLLELASGEEPDPLAVGGEERVRGTFGAGKRSSFELVESTDVDLRHTTGFPRDEREVVSVRREDRRRAPRQRDRIEREIGAELRVQA